MLYGKLDLWSINRSGKTEPDLVREYGHCIVRAVMAPCGGRSPSTCCAPVGKDAGLKSDRIHFVDGRRRAAIVCSSPYAPRRRRIGSGGDVPHAHTGGLEPAKTRQEGEFGEHMRRERTLAPFTTISLTRIGCSGKPNFRSGFAISRNATRRWTIASLHERGDQSRERDV